MRKRWVGLGALAIGVTLLLGACSWMQPGSIDQLGADRVQTFEVVVDGPLTDELLAELEGYGRVTDRFDAIGGVLIRAKQSAADALAGLSFVESIGSPAMRYAHNCAAGINTWDLDLINVTDYGEPRDVSQNGAGVYVAILDTGLVENWRDYLPEDRIAVDYAKAFNSGQSENSAVADVPHLWERDTESHGTHVASTILGYRIKSLDSPFDVNGVAPMATVIPVKVLGNSGGGWSPGIAAGIIYVTDLKPALDDAPMVINMSLGGPYLSPLEEAAINYAIANGVVVVASAGNEGETGMGYPGAYEPVISVGAIGWVDEWIGGTGFWAFDVPEPGTDDELIASVYVCDFSSREIGDQDLDVLAPGSWIVGPYLAYGAATPPLWSRGMPGEYYFLGGTSMAAPHVAGTVALLLQKNPNLEASAVEGVLEAAAVPLPAGSRSVDDGSGTPVEFTWDTDATGAGILLADRVLEP